MEKKTIISRTLLWGAVIASFSLAIMDMLFLQGVLQKNPTFSMPWQASFTAFALATIANIAALFWGQQKGLKKTGTSFMVAWIALGLVYLLIRGASFYDGVIKPNKLGDLKTVFDQLLPIIILTISYVGTGSTLVWAGKQLWDIDITNYLNAKKTFHEKNEIIAGNSAALWERIEKLRKYDSNYASLDKQYNKHKSKIRKTEKTTMARIVGRVIAKHPEISPEDANNVMESVLKERDEKNEKAHQA